MLKTGRFGEVIRFDSARTLWGKGRYWTSAYLVDGLLIDTGCAHTAVELGRTLADLPVAQIINTHSHEDHIGANALLERARPQIPLWAHPLALPVLADPLKTQPLHPYRRLYWGWPQPSHARPIADQAVLETERYRFRVIYTPGHSPDHLCLYEPTQGWLFTGDLFVGGQERTLRADYDIWQIIASLKRIAALPAARLFPACAHVREDAPASLAAKIAYLEQLGDKVSELDRQGRGVPEIARSVCGGQMLVEWVTLGHMSREHLIRSYLRSHAR